MHGLKKELISFFEETYLHGFKYLSHGTHPITKLIWASILACSLGCSVILIQNALIDWDENPVITSVESIDNPLKSIQFPTITVCRGEYFQPDNFALTEAVFNSFDFECGALEQQCDKQSQAMNDNFKPLFHLLHQKVGSFLKKIKINGYSYPSEARLRVITWALLNKKLTFSDLDSLLMDAIGKFATEKGFYRIILAKFNISEAIPAFTCNLSCLESQEKLEDFFMKANILRLPTRVGFGSVLRQLSPYLGITFDDAKINSGNTRSVSKVCKAINDIEDSLHAVMLQIGQSLGVNVSAHDLPNLYRVTTSWFKKTDFRKNQPFLTFCKNDIRAYKKDSSLPFCPQSWYTLTDITKNPYLAENENFCSGGASQLTGKNLTSIMKVMKFAYNFFEQIDIDELESILNTKNKQQKPVSRRVFAEIMDKNVPQVFKPTITAKGLCHSWNALGSEKLVKRSEYSDAYLKVFKDHEETILNGGIQKVSIKLNSHSKYLNDRAGNDDDDFLLGLTTKETPFNMFSSPVIIRKGFKTIIRVKPTQVVTDHSVKVELTPEKRKCRFRDEVPNNMTIFQEYSLPGCLFECMKEYSFNQCLCLPWNVWHKDKDMSKELCDAAGNDCFWTNMKNFTFMNNECYCLPDCNSIKFHVAEKQIPIDVSQECDGLGKGLQNVFRATSRTAPLFVIFMDSMAENRSHYEWRSDFKHMEYAKRMCKEVYKHDIAFVDVQFEGESHLKLRQSLKVTLVDKVGNIGGTLGLFCGFSIIAAFELVHWILTILKKYVAKEK